MATLEELTRGAAVRGILPDGLVTISDVRWIGTAGIALARHRHRWNSSSETIHQSLRRDAYSFSSLIDPLFKQDQDFGTLLATASKAESSRQQRKGGEHE